MNRPATAVFAALEALLAVGIGLGIPVIALTLMWAFQYGLQIDWLVFWRAAVDFWLAGHGVDLTFALSPESAAATGVSGAADPISITMAVLGFSALTVFLGARAGRAIGETAHRMVGIGSAVGAFAILSTVVTLTARHPQAMPSLWQGIVLPTLVYAIPVVVAAEVARRRRSEPADPVTGFVLRLVERIPGHARIVAAAGLRVGAASSLVVLAVSGLVVALLLLTHYAQIITLYESAHAGLLGGIALTLGQLALLPNAVVWAMSWFVGPGFALGTGSSISPLGTHVGPMPSVPFLGALPTSDLAFGFVGLVVPVVAAFVVTTLLRTRAERLLGRANDVVHRILIGVSAGVAGGLVLGLLAWAAAGSAGPGRLAHVGSAPLLVGGFAALEIAIPAVIAMVVTPPRFVGRADDDRDRAEGRSRASDAHESAVPTPATIAGGAGPDEQATDRIEGLTR